MKAEAPAKATRVNYHWIILGGILLVAIVLRSWSLNYGLPFSYHFDETTYTGAALNLGRGQIGPQYNPTGYINIEFIEFLLYFGVGKVLNIFSTSSDFANLYRTDPTNFLLLGRLTSALLGSLTVIVIYQIGKIIYSSFAGYLSAFFLAVAFLHVRDSHFAVPDIVLTFFIGCSILFSLLAVRQRKTMFLYLAGAAAGYAIATKWTAWPVLIPLAVAIWSGFRETDNRFEKIALFRRIANHWMIGGVFFVLVGFTLGGFQVLLKPMAYFNYALEESQAGSAGGFNIWLIDTVPGWVFYAKTLYWGLGPVLLGLGFVGFLFSFLQTWRPLDGARGLLISFPLVYIIVMGATRHYFARYALPLIPFVALFAGLAVGWLSRRLKRRFPKLALALTALLVLSAVAPTAANSIRYGLMTGSPDTRTLAKQWIEREILDGAKIAMDWPVHGPYLSTQEKPAPASKRVYRLTTFMDGAGLSDHPLEWYREQGFQYLISSSFVSEIPLVDPIKEEERENFYLQLYQEVELVSEFKPFEGDTPPPFIFDELYGPFISLNERVRPGPTLKIYRLD